MDFLIAAGITHDAFVPLHEVRKRITDIHKLFSLHRKWLPAGLRKRGDRMLASPDNAKALLSFLPAAAGGGGKTSGGPRHVQCKGCDVVPAPANISMTT